LDLIFADLEYGVDEELEEFERRLLILLTETMEETLMSYSINNGLGTSSRQANLSFLILTPQSAYSPKR
jgi:hypothetical protein